MAGDAARLKAGAQAGTTGVAAYDEAASTVKAQQASAIKGLKADVGSVGGGSRLLGSLEAPIRAAGNVALGNITSQGTAAGYFADQTQSGVSNYMNEVNSALPMIRSEADKELAQQLAMLNASRAGSGGGGGGGGGAGGELSDAELRNRIMGLARANREQMFAQAQKQYRAALAHADKTYVYSRPDQPISQGPAGRALDQGSVGPALLDKLARRRQDIYDTEHGAAVQRQNAIQQMRVRAFGPGITREAQNLAIEAGVSPDRAYGLFGPAEEKSYLAQMKSLGYYKPPSKTRTYSDLPLDPMEAGKSLVGSGERLKPEDVSKSLGQKYFDWNDPQLQKAFSQWIKDPKLNRGNFDAADPAARTAFEQANPQGAKPVVSDIVNEAANYAKQGYDFQTYAQMLAQGDPNYQRFPREYALALTMAQPLFQAAQVGGIRRVPTYASGG